MQSFQVIEAEAKEAEAKEAKTIGLEDDLEIEEFEEEVKEESEEEIEEETEEEKAHSIHNTEQAPLNNIVIVGAGPVGLACANRLSQAGLQPTLLDPRFDQYSRSGDFISELFWEAKKMSAVSSLEVPNYFSPGLHQIKYLERGLAKGVKERKLPTLNASFVRFKQKSLEILDKKTGLSRFLPCDIVIDCTGSGAVLKAANELDSKHLKFNYMELKSPEKNMLAQIYLSPGDAEVLMKSSSKVRHWQINFVEDATHDTAMKMFRSLNWQGHAFPQFYVRIINREKQKYNLYTDAPEGLTDYAQQIKWLDSIVSYALNREAKIQIAETFSKKNRVFYFPVDYRYTTDPFYSGDEQLPIIFHAGDSSAKMPYFTGQSLRLGLERLEELLDAFVVDNKSLTRIKSETYKKSYQKLLDQYKEMAVDEQQFRGEPDSYARQQINRLLQKASDGLNAAKQHFDKSLLQLSINDLKRATILSPDERNVEGLWGQVPSINAKERVYDQALNFLSKYSPKFNFENKIILFRNMTVRADKNKDDKAVLEISKAALKNESRHRNTNPISFNIQESICVILYLRVIALANVVEKFIRERNRPQVLNIQKEMEFLQRKYEQHMPASGPDINMLQLQKDNKEMQALVRNLALVLAPKKKPESTTSSHYSQNSPHPLFAVEEKQNPIPSSSNSQQQFSL